MPSTKKQVRGSNPRGVPDGSTPLGANSQSKYWCFTINNPKPNFKDLDGALNWDYLIAGDEICPKTGTPHLQCFIVYKVRTKFSTVKNQLPRAHIERMISTPEKAAAYCRKDGKSFECGTLPDYYGGKTGGQKKAENFRAMIDLAMAGDLNEIIEVDPVSYVQHYHAYKRIQQDNPKRVQDLDDVCGEWLWGEPGVGKSYRARKENPNHYDKPLNKWWDGYRGEDCIILDDVGLGQGSWIGDLLKRWADRYSYPAEQKGTTVQIRPKKIVVTSNYTIEQIFQDETLAKAVSRRFKEIEVKDWKDTVPTQYAEDTQEEDSQPDEEDWEEFNNRELED